MPQPIAIGRDIGCRPKRNGSLRRVIESGTQPIAMLRAVAPPRRSISESIALAEARAKELGYKPIMDAEFAADMEEIIGHRRPRDRSAWD